MKLWKVYIRQAKEIRSKRPVRKDHVTVFMTKSETQQEAERLAIEISPCIVCQFAGRGIVGSIRLPGFAGCDDCLHADSG